MPFEDNAVIVDTSTQPNATNDDWHVDYPFPGLETNAVKDHCRALFTALENSCQIDEDGCHVFPNGNAFFICTNWANLTLQYFGSDRTVVMGYLHQDNETSAISAQYEGHDFAIVDGRYIVDGWVTGVGLEKHGRETPGLYDLESEDDAEEINRLYGKKSAWELSGSSYAMIAPKPF